MSPKQRIRQRIREEGGCWIWQGRTAGGTPILEVSGERCTVRRIMWNKGPRPSHIGSTCRNRLCVRPYHLIAIRSKVFKPEPQPNEIVQYMIDNPEDHTGCLVKFEGLSRSKLIEILTEYYLDLSATQDQYFDTEGNIDLPIRRFRR